MAIEVLRPAVEGGVTAAVPVRLYAPSWMNWIITAIDRLPGPAWLAFLGLIGIEIVWRSSVGWVGGWSPIGSFDLALLPFAVYPVFPFALIYILDRAAARAVPAFAPALEASPAEMERIEYEMRIIPGRSAAIVGMLGAGYALILWYVDPVSAGVAGTPLPALIVQAAGECLYFAAWVVLMYQVFRQLRLVSRLHGRATLLNLFRPAPLYAFSRLTVRAGTGFVLIAGFEVLMSGGSLSVANIASATTAAALGVAAFIVPLLGLHARLADEKDVLLSGATERLPNAIDRLNAALDAGDLVQAGQAQTALAGLVQEHEIVGRLRTWPWDPGTLVAFASVAVLPIVLWGVTRLLERLF